jgi:hypothetical protein
MSKATPKAGITLFSKEGDALKFVHSPTASGDVSLKHKFSNKVTLGVGFSVSEMDMFPSMYRAGASDKLITRSSTARRTRP